MDNKIFTTYNLQVGPITVKSAFGHGGAQNEKTPVGGGAYQKSEWPPGLVILKMKQSYFESFRWNPATLATHSIWKKTDIVSKF